MNQKKTGKSKFYSEDSLSSTCMFPSMLCCYYVIIDKTTTTKIEQSCGINPQPYLISAFSIKLIAKPTLFWSFLWKKFKLKILVKNPRVQLIIMRE